MEKFSNNKILIKKLINLNKTISCMESCTGGMLASEITNVEGASKAFSLGIVTYSNEEKIKYGVNKEIIDEYTVYSNEVSEEIWTSGQEDIPGDSYWTEQGIRSSKRFIGWYDWNTESGWKIVYYYIPFIGRSDCKECF